MGQHFKLTSREFHDDAGLFQVLEIKAGQVIGKDYKELSSGLKNNIGNWLLHTTLIKMETQKDLKILTKLIKN